MSKVDRFFKISATEYDNYVRAEWQQYVDHPARANESLAALEGLVVERALDIGCGSGQELIPFVVKGSAFGVGVDVVPETGRVGRELFSELLDEARVSFVRSAAEALPFQTGSFDVAVCRLALPYTENDRALSEMARVLRPGGVLLLKIHHAAYYLRKAESGLRAADARSVIHALRVLTSGVLYYATNRQPRTRLTGGETFQTRGLLRRKLAPLGMSIESELPDSNPATPSFVIRKSTRRD
ncbi:MAG: class I SAM-dependent methyltransferase [Pyrinomonadaceae bacterium]|nr:class I SAM-dependent methyltransferase [Pyrinomonadaceae bacterium]